MELMIEMTAIPGRAQELYQTLQALVPTIRAEKGSLECEVSQAKDKRDVFYLWSSWKEQANLEHYVRSVSGSALIGAIDLLSTATRVRFGQDAPWQTIDNLKHMRV